MVSLCALEIRLTHFRFKLNEFIKKSNGSLEADLNFKHTMIISIFHGRKLCKSEAVGAVTEQ